MSEERYQTALNASQTTYAHGLKYPLNRDRFMDKTADLRKMKGAIEEMQNGEKEMAKGLFNNAEPHYYTALKQAPNDYAGLVMMAKCQLAQNRPSAAERYAEKAKQVYPNEAQAHHVAGMAKMSKKRYAAAHEDFNNYERMMPGNANTIFLKGISLDRMGRRRDAANEYSRYLRIDRQGQQAQYAYRRLVDWGYIKGR